MRWNDSASPLSVLWVSTRVCQSPRPIEIVHAESALRGEGIPFDDAEGVAALLAVRQAVIQRQRVEAETDVDRPAAGGGVVVMRRLPAPSVESKFSSGAELRPLRTRGGSLSPAVSS